MENLRIRQFRQKIVQCVNQERLPIEVKRLVLLELLQQTEKAAEEKIEQEIEITKTLEEENANKNKGTADDEEKKGE